MNHRLIALLLFHCCYTLCLGQPQHTPPATYAESSVLASGKWVKIAVQQSNIYRLSYEQLIDMGLNPASVRLFGYGGALLPELFTAPYIDDLPEQPIFFETGADGIFGPGDYIIFYAQGPISWQYNTTGAWAGLFTHTQNCYSTTGYYFLTSDRGQGLHMTTQTAEVDSPAGTINIFTDYAVHERDLRNFLNSGREFYGEEFNQDSVLRTFNFKMANLQHRPLKIRVNAAARALTATKLTVTCNGMTGTSVSLLPRVASNNLEYATTATSVSTFTPATNHAIDVTLTYTGTSTAMCWLNFIEINAVRALTLTNAQPLFFRTADYVGQGLVHDFVLQGATDATQIWDITDARHIVRIPATLIGHTLTFRASTNTIHEYVAVTPAGVSLTPTVVGNVANQNLHALPQTDMVIIAPTEFLNEAERLAALHRNYDGMTVCTVDAVQIYNEFSSGTPDATAYRRLMKMFYDRAQTHGHAPRYLLLFGDGSFDNRGLLNNTSEPIRRLLTYESYNSVYEGLSYVSDDYFTYLDDHEGMMTPTDTMDIGVGRFPVHTKAQARTAVDKTQAYLENVQRGQWKNQILFIADDGDDNEHIKSADSVAQLTTQQNPDLLVRKLYLDAYQQETSTSGERYPEVEKLLDNYIKQGILMINYMGHGGYTGWSNEGILNIERITNMYNERFPLFVTATCDFSRYDDFRSTAGEQLFRNPHGGTMALFTTTRTVYAAPNFELNCNFTRNLFAKDHQGRPLCFGEIIRRAKNTQHSANKFSFTLLGDPALRLAYPYAYKVHTDSINGHVVNAVGDTLSALSEVRLSGHIADTLGNIVTDFEGVVQVNVFDKIERITTRCNDATADHDNVPFVFNDRPNPIFAGNAEVHGGRFNLIFMVPKDIRYNFGRGRIVYYADDNGREANGSYEQIVVGGENTQVPIDTTGPQIQLYLNTPEFTSGDKVDESPLLIAKIFDQSGINTIGSGIGHDILLRLDHDVNSEYVLNNYYKSDVNTYKSGTISYEITGLSEGPHTLTLRVWDLQNNSSSVATEFHVVIGLKPHMDNFYAYPNPATTQVTFVYEHDRPEAPHDLTVSVYDFTGRCVWRSERTIINHEGNQSSVTWNISSDVLTVSSGIYLVRMDLSSGNSKSVHKTTKLIIKP